MTIFYSEYNSPERRVEFEHVTGIDTEDNTVAFIAYLNFKVISDLADKVEALTREIEELKQGSRR